MSNYPEITDVFTDKIGGNTISSSDPNNSFAGIEAIEGLVGALGKPQSWSTTLMTLLRQYRRGMTLSIVSGAPVISAGEALLENTNGTKWVLRRNTADVTLSASNLDSGSMAAATYYVYALGGTAATTAPIQFSTDAYAPSGIGTAPYKGLGLFFNYSAGLTPTGYTSYASQNAPKHYDSGWFAIAISSQYTFIHNLGTLKLQATTQFATDANGANCNLLVENDQAASKGCVVYNVTTTAVSVQTLGAIRLWNGADAAATYARIILTALE